MKWILLVLLATDAPACTAIGGDRILGRDLAAVSGFAGLDPALEIAPAPAAGARRVFRAEELAGLARRHGMAEPTPPAEVCFERSVEFLSEEKLRPILQAAWGPHDAGMQILDFSRQALPPGRLEFPRAALEPSGLWRGRLVYAEGRSIPIWVRLRSTAPPTPLPQVARGDKVRVEVWSGGVLLAFDAAAETAGRIGESVLIKNPENGRRFRARVESPGKVSVKK